MSPEDASQNSTSAVTSAPRGDDPGPDFIDARQLAKMFSPPLSIGLIRRLQKRRAIPFAKIGRRVVFSRERVRAAVMERLTIDARRR